MIPFKKLPISKTLPNRFTGTNKSKQGINLAAVYSEKAAFFINSCIKQRAYPVGLEFAGLLWLKCYQI